MEILIESTEKKEKKGFLHSDIPIGSIDLEKKAMLAKHLAILLKSGLTISESLEIVENQERGKVKSIIRLVKKSVEAGNSLSASFGRFPKIFSGLFVNAVLAGEKSGNLESNFENIAEKLKKDKELYSKIKGAMFYPVVVLSAALVLGLFVSFTVLPKIIPLFTGFGMDLPLMTRLLIFFSNFLQENKAAVLIGIVSFVVIFSWLIKQKFAQPTIDFILLHIPIIKSISRDSNLASFCRTLGTLMKSGINIDESLAITRDTLDNVYYKRIAVKALAQVLKGGKISDALKLEPNLIPMMTVSLINVGEKSGNLEETLIFLAEIYEEEVDFSTRALSTIIEPILLIGIGLVVGGLAMAIITPIYQITGSVQK